MNVKLFYKTKQIFMLKWLNVRTCVWFVADGFVCFFFRKYYLSKQVQYVNYMSVAASSWESNLIRCWKNIQWNLSTNRRDKQNIKQPQSMILINWWTPNVTAALQQRTTLICTVLEKQKQKKNSETLKTTKSTTYNSNDMKTKREWGERRYEFIYLF